jgi:hypothetical protein
MTSRDEFFGILPLDNNVFKIFNHTGGISWDLQFEPGLARPLAPVFVKMASRDLGLPWNIGWKAELLGGHVDGWVAIKGKKISVRAEGGYHDDTYGNWNFLTQPYLWFAFSGGHRHVLFGDMYKNDYRPIGLRIYNDEGDLLADYPPGTYSIRLSNIQRTDFSTVDILSSFPQFFEFEKAPNNFMYPFAREYPEAFVVSTHDGKVTVTLNVETVFAMQPKVPLAHFVFGLGYMDSYVVKGELQMKDGTRISGRGGLQYLRNSRDSLRVIEEYNR